MTQILFSNYSHREKNWKKSKCDKLQHIKWKWIFDTVWRRKKTHTEQIPNSFDGRTFLSLLSKRKSLAITLLRLMAKRSESIMNVIHIPQMQFSVVARSDRGTSAQMPCHLYATERRQPTMNENTTNAHPSVVQPSHSTCQKEEEKNNTRRQSMHPSTLEFSHLKASSNCLFTVTPKCFSATYNLRTIANCNFSICDFPSVHSPSPPHLLSPACFSIGVYDVCI